MFSTNRESVLSTILNKWFDERVLYKNKMKDNEKMKYDLAASFQNTINKILYKKTKNA